MSFIRLLAPFAVSLIVFPALIEASAGEPVVLDRVPGLKARLEIVVDREGVPHVRARDEADALFGLGYMHARDRLWQLENLRRLGTGRLAEVLGPPALERDKLFRTLGVAQSAAATWRRYPQAIKDLITSYVAGCNAAIERQRENGLPVEFVLLNFEPEPWRPEDVLVVAKVLGWTVDHNWNQELLRAQIVQKVGVARAAELMPAYTPDGPIILPQSRTVYARSNRRKEAARTQRLDGDILSELAALDRRIAESSGLVGVGIGSNNQVLSGARTTTGSPMLAADPHLPSQIPSIFYRVHLTGGALDAIGATVAGLPGVVMGHNGRIAWGWTNANADVQDLYIERIFGNQVEYDGAREPLQIRNETIRIKGAADVVLPVRSTRHGPIISDLVNPSGPALALRWAALDDDDDVGMAAYLHANRAGDWSQFTDAFRRFKSHPQNLVYADASGNIAYVLAGAIPVREASDGSAPIPGWTSAYEWKGYIPFDELPVSVNPQQGYIASSNNKIAPDGYRYTLSNSYAAPYRAARVREVLLAGSRFSPQDLERLQADVLAVHARELLPVLMNVTPANNTERQALELLRRWDFRVTSESPAAAVFEAWYIQLAEAVFADELGGALWTAYSDQLHMVSMALSSALRKNTAWCDNVQTAVRENCTSAASRGLAAALRRMAIAQGTEDLAAWQWSKVHHTIFFHPTFDTHPQFGPRFNRTVPNGGDKHTVNVASNPRWYEFDQRHVALYRQIIDLGDFSKSRWMAAPGQSGIVADRHYDDLIDEWQRVEYRPMLFTPQSIDEQAAARFEFRP